MTSENKHEKHTVERTLERLIAIAQAGLCYTTDPYDRERYEQLQRVVAELGQTILAIEPAQVAQLLQVEPGYRTPKVDVRAVVFDEESVLLVRESDGFWSVPGGWAEIGEAPSECALRELAEEAGYLARATQLLAVYDRDRHGHGPHAYHVYKLFFACEIVGRCERSGPDCDEARFFALDALPPLSLTRITERQIRAFYAQRCERRTETAFD